MMDLKLVPKQLAATTEDEHPVCKALDSSWDPKKNMKKQGNINLC